MAIVNISTYIDQDVDVELDDIDDGELVAHLREKGYVITGGATGAEPEPDVRSYEYLIWQALRSGRFDEVRTMCAEMCRERIGRFA